MLKAMYSFALLLMSILIFSCSEQSLNPSTSDDNNGSKVNYLSKTIWNTSSVYDWPTYSYYDPLYEVNITHSSPNHVFYFDNYAYHFAYYRVESGYTYTNTVIITVNGTYCSEITWNTPDYGGYYNSRWLGWHSFSYNGVSMQLNIYVSEYYEPMSVWSEPSQDQVRILEVVSPDVPTGFNVSPTMHNNLNQTVSISWTSSTDPDVTGYEIYRNKYYLVRGQLRNTGFQLVKTFTSRTVSSWYDNPGWGPDPHLGIGYYYKIRAIDSTHNLKSNFSSVKMSYLEDYDNILP